MTADTPKEQPNKKSRTLKPTALGKIPSPEVAHTPDFKHFHQEPSKVSTDEFLKSALDSIIATCMQKVGTPNPGRFASPPKFLMELRKGGENTKPFFRDLNPEQETLSCGELAAVIAKDVQRSFSTYLSSIQPSNLPAYMNMPTVVPGPKTRTTLGLIDIIAEPGL